MILPLLHGVLVKPDDVETKTASGIVIPDMVTDKERKATESGTVVRVGPRAFVDYGRSPDILNKGDKVQYARYSGKELKDVDGTSYLLLNDIDILCVILETENE
jgi:chaperonin GroES